MAALTRPAANEAGLSWLQRARAVVTALNLHFAGVGILVLVNLYLLIHLGLTWSVAHSQDADALAQQRVQLKTAQIAARVCMAVEIKFRVLWFMPVPGNTQVDCIDP